MRTDPINCSQAAARIVAVAGAHGRVGDGESVVHMAAEEQWSLHRWIAQSTPSDHASRISGDSVQEGPRPQRELRIGTSPQQTALQ